MLARYGYFKTTRAHNQSIMEVDHETFIYPRPFKLLLATTILGGGLALSFDEESETKATTGRESLTFVTLGLFGALFLGRLFLRNQFTKHTIAVYLLVAAIGLGTLSVTGHLGGDLVYKHGAGVNMISQSPSAIAKVFRED